MCYKPEDFTFNFDSVQYIRIADFCKHNNIFLYFSRHLENQNVANDLSETYCHVYLLFNDKWLRNIKYHVNIKNADGEHSSNNSFIMKETEHVTQY
jgi:hypothetical protein